MSAASIPLPTIGAAKYDEVGIYLLHSFVVKSEFEELLRNRKVGSMESSLVDEVHKGSWLVVKAPPAGERQDRGSHRRAHDGCGHCRQHAKEGGHGQRPQ